jgi:phosphate-selective porin OprO/OprP
MCLALSGWVLTGWTAVAVGQEATPSSQTATPTATPASPPASQDLLKRLGQMEGRLDQLTKQNETLLRENQVLAKKVGVTSSSNVSNPGPQGMTSEPPSGTGATGPDASGQSAFEAVGPEGMSGQPDSPGAGSRGGLSSTRGGGSRAGGGDPTSIGRAQEVGNQHLGKVGLNPYYDFDDGGIHFTTKDEEFSFGIAGMTQIDGMLYSRPTPGPDTSSGFYSPRSRIYFEGNATKPISWEFSFQNFYDVVQLLDAYVNFNYTDERFQVRIGRYKNPFTYEFYRIHIWDLMQPERSLFAVNYEANRRFGVMAWGVLDDQRIEYALGSFDSQRNGFDPVNSHQDFQAFVNFKPFYPWREGFLLRNLQFGGSCDVGTEHQTPVPAALRTNVSPGPSTVTTSSGANFAELPFLAFNSGVQELGTRDLWEAHLAYYLHGLSLVSAIEGGHESYALGGAPPVHIPISGWFVQSGYILTGETIRDRTLIQPLRPFDLRKGRFGLGAWEVAARYSQLDLDSRVFTAGLANPHDWTNHAKMVDVGLNWYLNQFVKVYFDWEHSMFGSPVLSTDGAFRRSNDLFWVRTQVYF